ncbi:hypothetical protein [Streptomyces sp. NPDC056296]|uniref:hypothetical protein n=1 Tax=Streptomyces sp. NPDC056296 TaxID=3345775 RepID=UPI0035DC5276
MGTGLTKVAQRDDSTVDTFDNKFDAATAMSNTRLMIQQKADVIAQWAPQAAADTVGRLIKQSKTLCIAVNLMIPAKENCVDSHPLTAAAAHAAVPARSPQRLLTPS